MDAICWTDWDSRIKTIQDIEGENKQRQKKGARLLDVPNIGYYDCFGIWFMGDLVGLIKTLSEEKSAIPLGTRTHVFLSEKPEKIVNGIHDLTVYSHSCRLYKWLGQGYHRGLVVLAEDVWANTAAEVYMESKTWSWILTDEQKFKIPDRGS